ncbi:MULTISPECIES: ABC transporter permease [Butyrivibrio]|uniref:Peptide/nickel transport system permease protein n=1 Tax=Butyrivibrio proteoclasticus TaxID=43305 RepID=A0A1I5SRX6_9FIRM|nr:MULTISPECIES: ABC transporter permease [Butyrivibrio]MBE5838641.1 ABC transporter permease [Butyrivibrio sp.]MBQ9304881.1 ABC transporter permease [Butyrivibrio sp.]SEG09760.1 peptide/nickel transport system permease protein [Butyrivibrio sp. Su6]SFP73489.1 peptide/nickel transport system permease protein [Butyrivibrio proteoclasticus]
MGKYILKRIGYMFIVLVVMSVLLFLIYNLVPNNRAYTDAKADMTAQKTRLRNASEEEKDKMFNDLYLEYQRRYGTDTDNMAVRYLRWVGIMPNYYGTYSGLLQGDFGYSYEFKDDVINVVQEPLKNTIFINIFATILALGITIPLGIVCAVHKGSKGDQAMQVITIIGYSLPTFVTAILFVWIFCSLLGIFPPSGMKTPGSNYTGWKWFVDRMYYMALPLITMTFCSLGSMTRYVRASMIDALSLDCIRTARAKGVTEKAVIYSHAWRNALIPIVTLVVGWFLGIFGGSLIFENTFGINGMGKLMIVSLRTQDFDVVILMQLFYVAISLIGNLIIDIVYGLVDPRVRVSA